MQQLAYIIFKGIRHSYLYLSASKYKLSKLMWASFVPILMVSLLVFFTNKGQIDSFHQQILNVNSHIPKFNVVNHHYQLQNGEKSLNYQSEDVQIIIDLPQNTSDEKHTPSIDTHKDEKFLTVAIRSNDVLIQAGNQQHHLNQPQNLFTNDTELKSLISQINNLKSLSYTILYIVLFLVNFIQFWILVFLSSLSTAVLNRSINHSLNVKERCKILSVIMIMPYVVFKTIQTLLSSSYFPIIIFVFLGVLLFKKALISNFKVQKTLNTFYQKILNESELIKDRIQNEDEYQKAITAIQQEKHKILKLKRNSLKEKDVNKLALIQQEIQESEAMIFLISKQIHQYRLRNNQENKDE